MSRYWQQLDLAHVLWADGPGWCVAIAVLWAGVLILGSRAHVRP